MPLSALPAHSLGATTVLLLVVLAALAVALQAVIIRSWTKSLLSSTPAEQSQSDHRLHPGPPAPDRAPNRTNSATPPAPSSLAPEAHGPPPKP